MNIKKLLTLLIVINSTACTATEYPVSNACKDQPAFEISELPLAFELKNINKITVLNGDTAASNISFKNDWLPDLDIITTNETRVSGGINKRGGFEKLGVTNITELFKKIKHGTTSDEYFINVKKAMKLSNPDNLQIIERDNYSIFITDNTLSDKDAIYIARKNDPRIMMLVANLNRDQKERLLSHTCL
jgi:hypothetical protein